MRPTLYGNRHAVSAGHYLAAAAGFSILEAGGNAIDAGCCAGMALAVLHPDEVNFAGVAPIMIRTGSGEITTIAGLGHWPAALPADLFMREHGGQLPMGVLRTVVPAAPDAWITALKSHGTMSFGDVAGAAIEFARDGFSVFPYLADELAAHADDFAAFPSTAVIFRPDGRVPQLGDVADLGRGGVAEAGADLVVGPDAGLAGRVPAFGQPPPARERSGRTAPGD